MAAIVEVTGARELRRTLRQAGDDLEDLKALHARIAAMVAGDAQARVPRRTGTLAATIRPAGTKTQAIIRAGYARVPYAGPIHWGWPKRHIRPQPFLQDAAQGTEPAWFALYADAVDQILATVKGA